MFTFFALLHMTCRAYSRLGSVCGSLIANSAQNVGRGSILYKVSPPQMPVPLKHMYNANILRAAFSIFVPTYTQGCVIHLADEVAGHSPADQLPIKKTREAPV